VRYRAGILAPAAKAGMIAGYGSMLPRGREERGRAGSWVSGGVDREKIERADYGRAGMQGGSLFDVRGAMPPLDPPMVVEATTKGETRVRFAEAMSY